MCESFIMSSVRCREVPPPKPSQKSAKPSSCSAPVTRTLLIRASMTPVPTDSPALFAAKIVIVITPPVSQPTSGQNGIIRS